MDWMMPTNDTLFCESKSKDLPSGYIIATVLDFILRRCIYQTHRTDGARRINQCADTRTDIRTFEPIVKPRSSMACIPRASGYRPLTHPMVVADTKRHGGHEWPRSTLCYGDVSRFSANTRAIIARWPPKNLATTTSVGQFRREWHGSIGSFAGSEVSWRMQIYTVGNLCTRPRVRNRKQGSMIQFASRSCPGVPSTNGYHLFREEVMQDKIALDRSEET